MAYQNVLAANSQNLPYIEAGLAKRNDLKNLIVSDSLISS